MLLTLLVTGEVDGLLSANLHRWSNGSGGHWARRGIDGRDESSLGSWSSNVSEASSHLACGAGCYSRCGCHCVLCVVYGLLQKTGKRNLLISLVSQAAVSKSSGILKLGPTIGVRFAALRRTSSILALSGTGVRRGRRTLNPKLSRVNLVRSPQQHSALTTVATLSGGLRNTEIELLESGAEDLWRAVCGEPSTVPYPNTVIGRA